MARLLSLILTIALLGCGVERTTEILNGGGGGGTDDDGGVPSKLQKAQKDSLRMTSMVISRIGEASELVFLALNDPEAERYELTCPRIIKGSRDWNEPQNDQLSFKVDWVSMRKSSLLSDDELSAAVGRPRGFIRAEDDGTRLAHADRRHA